MRDQRFSLTVLVGAVGAALGARDCAAQTVRPDEVRAIVAEAMADAETRSSMLAGADAGHDGKFFISGEGFRLNVGGWVQFRYLANFRDDAASDDFDGGFQTRRTRLVFDGNIGGARLQGDWFFRIMSDFSRSTGNLTLLDAYAGHHFENGWDVQWGQFKLPLLRERIVSGSKQLAVERSESLTFFDQDRSQGIQASKQNENNRFFFAFSDGINSDNTDVNSAVENDWALTARAEFKGKGDWKVFDDFTSPQGSDTTWMVGAAANLQGSRNTSAATDTDVIDLRYTVDVSLEGDGWNAFGAFVGDHAESDRLTSSPPDTDNFGAVLQGGYRFTQNTEGFLRWDSIFLDDDVVTAGDDDNFNFITVGVNQYYAGHAAKGTLDVVYSLDNSGDLSTLPSTGSGLLGDVDEGELVFRLQFQLMF